MGAKPKFTMLRGDVITVDELARMFKQMTGRAPTAAELEAARIELEADQPSAELPDAHFGGAGEQDPNWREGEQDSDPDDDELAETPADVIEMLGFDPAAIDD